MKLLSKQEVQVQKSQERKMEIDEAVKLAKKVDLLRKTVSEEEAKLIKFREATLLGLHKEIADLIKLKDSLTQEVVALKGKR